MKQNKKGFDQNESLNYKKICVKGANFIWLLIFVAGCQSSRTELSTPVVSEENSAPMVGEIPDLTGHWEFVNNEILVAAKAPETLIAREEMYSYQPFEIDVIFTADSFYHVYYPSELVMKGAYSIDSEFLTIDGPLGRSRYVSNQDTLILYRIDEGNYVKQTYQRRVSDDSIVSILKRDGFNYPLLADTWYLIRDASINNDGTEYVLEFPHTIPDSLVLTRAEILATMHSTRTIHMLTDGVKKEYQYGYNGYSDNFVGELILTPGDWYRGEEITIGFYRKSDY